MDAVHHLDTASVFACAAALSNVSPGPEDFEPRRCHLLSDDFDADLTLEWLVETLGRRTVRISMSTIACRPGVEAGLVKPAETDGAAELRSALSKQSARGPFNCDSSSRFWWNHFPAGCRRTFFCQSLVGLSLPTTARCPRVGAGPVETAQTEGQRGRVAEQNSTHQQGRGPANLPRSRRPSASPQLRKGHRENRRSGSQGCRGRIPGYYGGSVAWTVRPLQVEIVGALRSPQSTSTPQHNSRESRSIAERVPGTPKLGRGNNIQKQ